MKNFRNDEKFYAYKILIGVLFLCLQLSACDAPRNEQSTQNAKLLENKERCANLGKKYFEEYWRTNRSRNGSEEYWDDPEFHYSVHLNTCLIYIRSVDLNHKRHNADTPQWQLDMDREYPTYHDNEIIDVLSNKPLLKGYFSRDKNGSEKTLDTLDNVPNYTSEEFFKQKDILFEATPVKTEKPWYKFWQ